MKINNNFFKALFSAQIIVLAIKLGALGLLVLFYPKANWIHVGVVSIFIILIQAIMLASGFKNDTEIIE